MYSYDEECEAGGSQHLGAVDGSLPPPTASDALLPTRGEPEKNPPPFTRNVTSLKADAMKEVLRKASSLTRRQNPNDETHNHKRGTITTLITRLINLYLTSELNACRAGKFVAKLGMIF